MVGSVTAGEAGVWYLAVRVLGGRAERPLQRVGPACTSAHRISLADVVPDHVIAEARNPEGHAVRMDRAAWDHVLDQHVEMRDYLAETIAAISAPDHREPDARAGRERYFRRGGPLRWIRVVTELAGEANRVVTAFPQSNDPRSIGWQR